MDFSRLEKNIRDVIVEEQIKLGYRKEVIRLYYPLQSLNRFINAEYGAPQMQQILEKYFAKAASGGDDRRIQVSHKDDRFCLQIPENLVEQVHEEKRDTGFLTEFIALVQKHGCTIEDLQQVFCKYSSQVHFEQVSHGEFNYLLYFEDGTPDDYRYCITDEGCHMIYHRFTKEDYEDFAF